jgi:hypothetical protein
MEAVPRPFWPLLGLLCPNNWAAAGEAVETTTPTASVVITTHGELQEAMRVDSREGNLRAPEGSRAETE